MGVSKRLPTLSIEMNITSPLRQGSGMGELTSIVFIHLMYSQCMSPETIHLALITVCDARPRQQTLTLDHKEHPMTHDTPQAQNPVHMQATHLRPLEVSM